jgi:predicted SnoaL-like aldol condensation-catalyzing enzyme
MDPAHHQLVRRIVDEIWNHGQLKVADDLFARDYVNHGGLITDLVHGPEAIKASVVLMRRAFPALHITVNALTSAGEVLTVHWHGRNLPSGMLPAELDAGVSGVMRLRVVAGLIRESWVEWDQETAFERMGLRAAADAAPTGGLGCQPNQRL